VQSVVNQTYTNLEIILVDDGSPDNCGAICDEFATKDSRIKVIHKKNGGLSDARNVGMAASTGAYLSFVDSDDLLPPDALERLLSLAQTHDADLVIGGHSRFSEEPEPSAQSDQIRIMTPEEAMADMLKNGCASWARLYRRDIHPDTPFPAGEINEDEAIVLSLLERCNRVVITTAVVYYYRCRPESITTTNFSPKRMAWSRHCRQNLTYIQQKHPALAPLAVDRYRDSLMWTLTEIALSGQEYPDQVAQLSSQLKQNIKLFRKTPFVFPQDRIRMEILSHLPFRFYRWTLRLRRGAHKAGE
jgi:glycosyltransferase involved in cell wall biosynthesis